MNQNSKKPNDEKKYSLLSSFAQSITPAFAPKEVQQPSPMQQVTSKITGIHQADFKSSRRTGWFIGGLRVYNKWTNGDQDVNKEILGYGGAMIFLIVVPEFVTAFFA